MRFGYNTNGLANHSTQHAVALLHEIGYSSVALTIDHHCLNPFDSTWPRQARELAKLLRDYGMTSVIETGARYLLNKDCKHWPSLCAAPEQAQPRLELIRHALQVADILRSDAVSIWSGTANSGYTVEQAREYLAQNLTRALTLATNYGIPLGMEPEPGMFVERLSDYEQLREQLPHPYFRLTLDIGHLWCLQEIPLFDSITRCGDELVNVHLEDMRSGIHEHLMFGDGEMPMDQVMTALRATGYRGGIHVELSRHSHAGPEVARHSLRFLKALLSAKVSG